MKRRFLSLSVHSGEVHYLKCGKNVYLNVRGLEPFHLKVPGTESILFVTERLNGSVVFHFLNTNTLSEMEVSGDRSNFGSDIGGSPPSGDYRNFVDRVSANEIVLGTRSPEFTKLTFIDLKLKRVERVESEVIDRTEKVQRHLY